MPDDKLFSPFSLKNLNLKNRIGLAPMTRVSSPGDSIPRQDVLDMLVRRAQNGCAMVFTEAILTDYESAQGYPNQSRLVTDRQIRAWQKVVKAIRDAGAVAIMQMFHCGRISFPQINPAGRVIAPSAVAPRQVNRLTNSPFTLPDEMSRFDIDHVVSGFAETARGAVAAGFDGIEIHGAHGYLINQFLSAYSNRRTDDYGGTVKNRFRFAREVIAAVSSVIPREMPLTFRISNWGVADPEVSLFESADEWRQMIRYLDEQPVDAISVSTKNFAEKVYGTDRNMAQITREATEKPILICGRIYDRSTADEALKDADIILSAKSLLLNPDWVADIKAHKPLEPKTEEEANVAYTETPLP